MGATMGKSGSNFLDALPTQGTLHVVMLGLDSAGKTTALYRLKFDQYLNTVPTIGFNCEKVQGTIGKAKGAQFLVWDVGGQEKLRPLWRSYTRCTDGILFVVDSVDVERMEEAKMELLRTAKCPDNQGVPILILANKQDLPGARDHRELEKLLGLHELQYPAVNLTTMSSASSSTGNIAGCSKSNSCGNTSINMYGRSLTPTSQHSNKPFGYGSATVSSSNITKELGIQLQVSTTSSTGATANTCSSSTSLIEQQDSNGCVIDSRQTYTKFTYESPSTSTVTTPTTPASNNYLVMKKITTTTTAPTNSHQYKGWYIQPACAITGEGLQEGLEALYEMILKRRKLNKSYKKKR